MTPRLRSVLVALAFTAGTAAVTTYTLWPKTTLADGDDDRQGEWTDDGYKFGDVVVTTKLVRDDKSKTGWTLQRDLVNTSDAEASVQLDERIMRTISQRDSRADPPGAAVMTTRQNIKLAAREKRSVREAVPAWLAQQLTQAERADKAYAAALDRTAKTGNYKDPALHAPAVQFSVEHLRAPQRPSVVAAK